MATTQELIYCDSDVFLAYLDAKDKRRSLVVDVFEEVAASNSKKKIVTSTFSRVEVAFIQAEKDRRILDDNVEKIIDGLWNDESLIGFIELSDQVATEARQLIRRSMASGVKIKPGDATHLASALSVKASYLFTFNIDDFKFFFETEGLKICEPFVSSPRLPGIIT